VSDSSQCAIGMSRQRATKKDMRAFLLMGCTSRSMVFLFFPKRNFCVESHRLETCKDKGIILRRERAKDTYVRALVTYGASFSSLEIPNE
jgi:hypothetical protein